MSEPIERSRTFSWENVAENFETIRNLTGREFLQKMLEGERFAICDLRFAIAWFQTHRHSRYRRVDGIEEIMRSHAGDRAENQ